MYFPPTTFEFEFADATSKVFKRVKCLVCNRGLGGVSTLKKHCGQLVHRRKQTMRRVMTEEVAMFRTLGVTFGRSQLLDRFNQANQVCLNSFQYIICF